MRFIKLGLAQQGLWKDLAKRIHDLFVAMNQSPYAVLRRSICHFWDGVQDLQFVILEHVR